MGVVFLLILYLLSSSVSTSDKCTFRPVDIVFLLDESGSVGPYQFQQATDFVKQFVDNVEIGSSSGFQISVVTFASDAVIQFDLNDYNTQSTMKAAIENIQYGGGSTNTAAGLDMATNSVFTTVNGARNLAGMGKYAVVLTDGTSDNRNETIAAASRLKNKVDKLFALGVGNGLSWDELNDMASPTDASIPRTVFAVTSYETLHTVLLQVVDITCDGVDACKVNPCGSHGTCVYGINTYTCECDKGYFGFHCTDWRPCSLLPCQNSATCQFEYGDADYVCQCVPGYTGRHCETDINECASSPCQNGGTCNDLLNKFNCTCTHNFFGDRCERDICKPRPADLFFLLDSSASQTNKTFKSQLDFVSNFVDQVDIGEDDFQISVITFSYRANVEFRLRDHLNRDTVKAALNKVELKPGPTYTDTALDEVMNVKDSGYRPNGGTTKKIVVLVTDGMSTYRSKTLLAANNLRQHVDKIVTIGVGPGVSQVELLGVASSADEFSQTNSFSVSHADSLNTILRQLVAQACQKCYQSSKSDIVFLVDSSVSVSVDEFGIFKDAMIQIVDQSNVGSVTNGPIFSAFSYSDGIRQEFALTTYMNSSPDIIKTAIAKIHYNGGSTNVKSNLSEAVTYAKENMFGLGSGARNGARKFLILFVDGDIGFDKDVFESAKLDLHDMGVIISVFAISDNPNLDSLKSMASDTYSIFVYTNDSDLSMLKSLNTEFAYNICELD